MDDGISSRELTEPWESLESVVLSLPQSLQAAGQQARHGDVDRRLGDLDEELSQLHADLEKLAIKIAASPEFVYDAPARSAELSSQVARIQERFDLLVETPGMRERIETRRAQSALGLLRERLGDRNRLERDLIQAVGSGSKNLIQALAGRWWSGAESVDRLRVTIAEVRRGLVAAEPPKPQ